MITAKVLSATEKRRKAKILINEGVCKGCGLCVSVCNLHLIRMGDHISSKGYYPAEFVDPEAKCTGCTLCAIICPDVAIEVYRKEKRA